jgi:NAD(P)-dependent dehydrogenase (short-subunit alcohol dehydrogenase family)
MVVEPLKGQRAVVSGASGGIGGGCAVALAEAGADLILLGRSAERLGATDHAVRATGRTAERIECEIGNPESVANAFAQIGPVDIVINSAGANVPEPFVEVSPDTLDSLIEVNLKATFLVSQAGVRGMLADGRPGVVINISSQMGHVGDANRSAYCATKHGVEGLTRAMAVELAPHGIRVNAVAPTFVETPMTRPFFEDESFRRSVESRIPLGRLGTVAEVAGAVAFLASPAASLITGTSLLVDGGWTAR